MDWFLYDRDLHHKELRKQLAGTLLKRFGELLSNLFSILAIATKKACKTNAPSEALLVCRSADSPKEPSRLKTY